MTGPSELSWLVNFLQFISAVCDVKTTPQKTRFRSVNLFKEFVYRSKLNA